MTKLDLPPAGAVPKKRRVLHDAPDVHLAEWLARPDLKPSQRKLLEEEKKHRREQRPEVVAVLRPVEGVTPEQKSRVRGLVPLAPELRLYWTAGFGRTTHQEVIKGADRVVAAPKELHPPSGPTEGSVWEAIAYARHRKLPVVVIMPNGEELTQ